MLTPLDIQNKTFRRTFRGFDADQVDDFLDEIVNEMERLYRDNENLKAEITRLEKDNAQYLALEENLKQTLIVAQRTAEEIMAASRKNAEELRENTAHACQVMKQETEQIVREREKKAEERVHTAFAEYDRIKNACHQFLRKYKMALESELSFVDDNMQELSIKRETNACEKQSSEAVPERQDGQEDFGIMEESQEG